MKMIPGETSIGGRPAGFPHTTWGVASLLDGASADDRRRALETLCSRYWKPIYRYVRASWGRSNEDAKDVTQAFLLWLLEGDALAKYAPERGGFRGYLKLLLGRFVSHQAEALQALKRGGGARTVPLGTDVGLAPDPDARTPEEAFDRAWLAEVVRHAVERVRERLGRSGRALAMRVYESYELCEGTRPTYAEVAAKLGVKETDVRNHLFAVRSDVRQELRAELRETARSAEELEEEWHALFGN